MRTKIINFKDVQELFLNCSWIILGIISLRSQRMFKNCSWLVYWRHHYQFMNFFKNLCSWKVLKMPGSTYETLKYRGKMVHEWFMNSSSSGTLLLFLNCSWIHHGQLMMNLSRTVYDILFRNCSWTLFFKNWSRICLICTSRTFKMFHDCGCEPFMNFSRIIHELTDHFAGV